MLFFYVIVAITVGAYLGKFIASLTRELPVFLLEGCKEGGELRDVFHSCFTTSHCSQCQYPFLGWSDVPIIGYLSIQGHCPNCKRKIKKREWLIEVGLAILFGLTILFFSLTPMTLFVLSSSALLICCFMTDYEYCILPDQFTLTLLWLGLFFSLYHVFIDSHEAIIGAIVGYSIFWFINEIYRFFRHTNGIFPGDFKLNAGIGACVGYKAILIVLAISMVLLIIGTIIQFIYIHRKLDKEYLRKEASFGCYASVVAMAALYYFLI